MLVSLYGIYGMDDVKRPPPVTTEMKAQVRLSLTPVPGGHSHTNICIAGTWSLGHCDLRSTPMHTRMILLLVYYYKNSNNGETILRPNFDAVTQD